MPDPFFQPADPMAARRPYSWQTDEFQTKTKGRQRSTVEHFPGLNPNIVPGAQAMTLNSPRDITGNYRCPNCGTHYLPVIERKISQAGWITFALLLVFTFIFFWIGLLMKEDVSVCPVCRIRLNHR
ncbi:MAG: LITAF-like zinc ribbon domain-containing protein [Pyrinomonadaceae bacterium]